MSLRAYSLADAATVTGIRYRVLLEAAKGGSLRSFIPFGLSHKRFVREDELKRWMKSSENRKTPPVV